MQLVTRRYAEAFNQNTAYRFLSAAKTNWDNIVVPLDCKNVDPPVNLV